MSEIAAPTRRVWRDLLEMCKPRVVLLMLLCALVGMFLATPGMVPLDALVFGTLGIALVAASAAAVNHIADAEIDARMARTLDRPVATGRVNVRQGLWFSAITGLAGLSMLYALVNPLTAWLNLVLYAVCEARYPAEHRNRWVVRCRATAVRLDGRQQQHRTGRTAARVDHLRVDAPALLGARAGSEGRVPLGQCADAAGHAR
jgi:4-hydroxybenzoate polyprenyltransferase